MGVPIPWGAASCDPGPGVGPGPVHVHSTHPRTVQAGPRPSQGQGRQLWGQRDTGCPPAPWDGDTRPECGEAAVGSRSGQEAGLWRSTRVPVSTGCANRQLKDFTFQKGPQPSPACLLRPWDLCYLGRAVPAESMTQAHSAWGTGRSVQPHLWPAGCRAEGGAFKVRAQAADEQLAEVPGTRTWESPGWGRAGEASTSCPHPLLS